MNKSLIYVILGILLGILLSTLFDCFFINKNIKESFEIEKVLKQIELDSMKIDSLKKDIVMLKELNDSLSKKETIIDSIFIERVDQIKTLPIDSSVYLLKTNIEKYEKKYY